MFAHPISTIGVIFVSLETSGHLRDRESQPRAGQAAVRRQVPGRLEARRANRAARYRFPVFRHEPDARRRKLLRVPPARPAGDQLRDDRAVAAQLRQDPRLRPGNAEVRLGQGVQRARVLGVLEHAAFRRAGHPLRAAAQGRRRAADGPTIARQPIARTIAAAQAVAGPHGRARSRAHPACRPSCSAANSCN